MMAFYVKNRLVFKKPIQLYMPYFNLYEISQGLLKKMNIRSDRILNYVEQDLDPRFQKKWILDLQKNEAWILGQNFQCWLKIHFLANYTHFKYYNNSISK